MKPLALVIESDTGTRKLLDVLLTRFGYEADLVASGSDAVLLLSAVEYDVILAGTSSESVLHWIATHRAGDMHRVIVLSSATESHIESLRTDLPAARVIRKPFDVGEVIDAAREASAGHETREREAAGDFCRRSVLAGAHAGLLVRHNGKRITLVATFGYEPGVAESWFPADVGDADPVCASMRAGHAIWLSPLTLARTEYPHLAPIWDRIQSHAVAAVPVTRAGTIVGAAGWSFDEPRRFDDDEQLALIEIAEAATAAIAGDEHSDQSDRGAGA